MDTYPLLVILLVTVGLAALVGELMLPSAGILTFIALGCLGGSAWCAWQAWYATGHLLAWWSYVGTVLVLLPTVISVTLYILPRTPIGRELFAAPQSGDDLTPFREEDQKLRSLVDQHGHTQTLFSPGGMVQIGRSRYHAESEGVIIDPDTEVVVIGVKGNRLVVRPLSLDTAASGIAGPDTAASDTASPDTTAPDTTASDTAGNRPAVTDTAVPERNVDPANSSSDDPSIDFDVPETA